MTQPVPHGYPDWSRFTPSADKFLDFQSRAAFAGPETFGPYFVGDVEWVHIMCNATTNNFRFRFSFVDDVLLTHQLAQQDAVFRAVSASALSLPVRGPYLTVGVTASGAGSAFDFTLSSAKSGGLMVPAQSAENILIGTIGTAVGAGATTTVVATRTHPGPAVWSVFTALATWTALMDSVDHVGGLARLDSIDNTNAKAERRTHLPYQPAQIRVTNTTGAAGVFNASLVAAPTYPIHG